MDTSLNTPKIQTSPQDFVSQNASVFEKINNSLKEVAKNAKSHLNSIVSLDNRIDNTLLEKHQFEAHGLAWFETYRIGLRETFNWYNSLKENNKATELEASVLIYAFAEYLSQMKNGIMISQSEMIRPSSLGLKDANFDFCESSDVAELISLGLSEVPLNFINDAIDNGIFPDLGLNDDTLNMIQDQFKKFTDEEIVPHANEWHLKDDLIPDNVLKKMADLGVFSIAIPEDYGGLGMGKVAMCVVTEELSRGFLAAGSLGTRAEIAGELIRLGGTEEQKNKYLPEIAAGNILTTAVFTEPNTGSDLGSLATRAQLDGEDYVINGNKTWITHGARSDLMTVLARTDSDQKGYRGLSMFLVEKPRGNCEKPFSNGRYVWK